MSERANRVNRRRFLKTAAQAGAVLAVPCVIPGAVLGKNGAVAPSEKIVLSSNPASPSSTHRPLAVNRQ